MTSGGEEIYEWTAWALPGMFTQDNISVVSTERCHEYRSRYTILERVMQVDSSDDTDETEDDD